MLEHLLRDLAYGARQLRRQPAFAAVAVLSLALGIGANAAIFSIVRAVLLAEPPYARPAELVRLTQQFPALGEGQLGTSPAEYLDYRDRNRGFAAIGGFMRDSVDARGRGETERLDVLRVSASLFPTLGVAPLVGRGFTTAEETPGADRVAILGFDYWTRRYAADPNAIGLTLILNEQPYTIVGVMPPDFEFPATKATVDEPPALWVPLAYTPKQIADRAAEFGTRVVARLRPGVSIDQARQDVTRIADAFQRENPGIYAGTIKLRATLDPLTAQTVSRARPVLVVLAAAVVCVLLTACANVANLLLGRASARQREMAVRRALGAGTSRIVRQLLTESLLLSGIGGVLGCLVAILMTRAASTLWPGQIVSLRGVTIDGLVLSFTLGLSMLTGVLCGLAPALESRGGHSGEALKQTGRQMGVGRERRRFRQALVVFEAASAVVLLVGAGLLVHSFIEVLRVPLGLDPTNVVIVRTGFTRERYPDADRRHQTERAIEQRLRALPGASAVALATHIPLADDRQIGFALERDAVAGPHWADNSLVTGDYFAAMGIPLVRGRTFTDADTPQSPLVAMVNESLVRRYFGTRDPIGERLLWGGRQLTIVGIVGDVHLKALDEEVEPTIYSPVYQIESGATRFAVFLIRSRTSANEAAMAASARAAIHAVDPGLAVFEVKAMSQIVERSLASRRFLIVLLTTFAGLALVLATIGLYAVLSHAVTQRTQELGLRLALGAHPTTLLRLVMSDGVRLVVIGLVLGAVAAAALTGTMSALLFRVERLDPLAFLGAAGLLLIVSLIASLIPARRAARVDPMTALRSE